MINLLVTLFIIKLYARNKEDLRHKLGLEAKYQKVTDSESKINSTVWRTTPQVSKYRLMVYKFIRWQTNQR